MTTIESWWCYLWQDVVVPRVCVGREVVWCMLESCGIGVWGIWRGGN